MSCNLFACYECGLTEWNEMRCFVGGFEHYALKTCIEHVHDQNVACCFV